MAQIIFLHEIYESRKQKQIELDYYIQQVEMLQQRMIMVRKEIELTENIIKIIEHEMSKK
jgi:prefoldin subunit 5